MAQLSDNPALTNVFGPLGVDIQQRIRELLADPRKYWDRDAGLILRWDGGVHLSVWQAVMAVDPTFPRTGRVTDQHGRVIEDWHRYPDAVLVARAIRYAATAKRECAA